MTKERPIQRMSRPPHWPSTKVPWSRGTTGATTTTVHPHRRPGVILRFSCCTYCPDSTRNTSPGRQSRPTRRPVRNRPCRCCRRSCGSRSEKCCSRKSIGPAQNTPPFKHQHRQFSQNTQFSPANQYS